MVIIYNPCRSLAPDLSTFQCVLNAQDYAMLANMQKQMYVESLGGCFFFQALLFL